MVLHACHQLVDLTELLRSLLHLGASHVLCSRDYQVLNVVRNQIECLFLLRELLQSLFHLGHAVVLGVELLLLLLQFVLKLGF